MGKRTDETEALLGYVLECILFLRHEPRVVASEYWVKLTLPRLPIDQREQVPQSMSRPRSRRLKAIPKSRSKEMMQAELCMRNTHHHEVRRIHAGW